MILHTGYGRESDSLTGIKDDLELQETVETLKRKGLVSGTFDDFSVRAVRPPHVNYVIGHGAMGVMLDQPDEAEFAKQLVGHGIQIGDEIVLVVCYSGIATGVAERLADALGALGRTGVRVSGALDYVHWTTGGELLLKKYPARNKIISDAERAYVKAEDTAWGVYVAYLKASAIKAMKVALATKEAAIVNRIVEFAKTRSKDNQTALAAHIGKAQQRVSTEAALRNIIQQSTPNYVLDDQQKVLRDRSHRSWSEDLRGLLTDLSVIADPVGGALKAAGKVTKARTNLRDKLAVAWPAYSTGYFEQMRGLITPETAGGRRTFTSAFNVIATPVYRAPVEPVVRTVQETHVAETPADIDAIINELLRELDF